jgi:hypothetical protein
MYGRTAMKDFGLRTFRRLFILVCVVAYGCILATTTAAGELGKAKLSDKPIEVLGGRLTVRMPQRAKVQARPNDIMSAPESEEHETRVVYDAGQERLVLMVQESFVFAGDDFEKDVRDWVAKWKGKYRIEPVQLLIKGLKTVSVIPLNLPDHTRSADATFVEGVFVVSDDRTIQSVDVYLNAVAEQDLEGCKAIAHQILMSLAQGKNRLKLSAGERQFSANSQDFEISVTVPKNMVVTEQIGPDFLVHRLITLGRLGANSENIGIYVGNHPSFHPGAKKSDGMMFGKQVEWRSFQQGAGLEALCELPIPGELPLFAHVWVQAPEDARLGELKQVAETMKVIKVKNPATR